MSQSKNASGRKTRAALISILISTTIFSTACSSVFGPSPSLDCHRPNDPQRESWRAIVRASRSDRPEFAEGVRWISDILEKDCFPREAEAAADA